MRLSYHAPCLRVSRTRPRLAHSLRSFARSTFTDLALWHKNRVPKNAAARTYESLCTLLERMERAAEGGVSATQTAYDVEPVERVIDVYCSWSGQWITVDGMVVLVVVVVVAVNLFMCLTIMLMVMLMLRIILLLLALLRYYFSRIHCGIPAPSHNHALLIGTAALSRTRAT